jgi:hypothetical protein
VNQVEAIDAPRLARASLAAITEPSAALAHGWRHRHYDLAINFEGIRSHGLMALSRRARRVGWNGRRRAAAD